MLGLGKLLTLEKLTEGVTFTNTKSVTFNGTSQGMDTGYGVDAAIRGSFTYSMWLKPTDGIPSNIGSLIGTFPSMSPMLVMNCGITTAGKLFFSFLVASKNVTITADAASFSDGAASSWSHVAVVWTRVGDSDAGTGVIYKNGSAIATTTTGTGITGTEQDSATFSGGEYHIAYVDTTISGPVQFFLGEMDEFALFREALSASGISEIYNSGVPTDLTLGGSNFSATNLELYYRFEDDFTDTTGTSDGTGVNSPTFTTDVPE